MATEASEAGPALSLEAIQERVRRYWESTGVPGRVLAGSPDGPEFRFTEGPPTANGVPHVGHLIARALKDVHLRYRRMRGDRIVSAMAGWDCHGLPVELEVEKRLGLHTKQEIESYGVERFCQACRAGTLEVAGVWEEMSQRLGYWLDYAHPYYTMSPPYIESVWWSLKRLFEEERLEKGHYVLPYCPRCETPLSSHEVAQGYRETTDPSLTVRVALSASPPGGRYLLVWTTTPWTLPSNLLIAAHPDLAYVGIRGPEGEELLLAEPALLRYRPEGAEIVHRYNARELEGLAYEPLFPFAGPGEGRYRIVLDRMVEASEGTGFVHIAPSFGPEDQRIGDREGVGRFDPLDGRGVFTERVPLVAGASFKAADPLLVADLADRHLVERSETLRHTYPYCWRCSHALLYRAIDCWFVRTHRFVGPLVEGNRSVTWVPAHLRDGRFGNFLDEAKDWALSRNRYWGTPLPIWLCRAGHATCVGSFAELAERSGAPLPVPFDPHRVTVDRIRIACATCGAEAVREPYTIDGWYDSGAAPFAQYHYPFEPGPFRPEAPLDFVAEGLDQTRGWFYTLHVLSTALFHRPAYRVAIATGLVLDDSGQKMSKSRGRAVEPMSLLERLGGDTVRWGFFLSDYTEAIRFQEASFRQAANRTVGTLLHAAAFYRENASADRLGPTEGVPTPTALLDRWLLSRLDGTREAVGTSLDHFDPRRGALALRSLVDDLSTWYLRRSRPRFWSDDDPADRRSANATLSFTLLTLAKLAAPFVPFAAEELYQEIRETAFRSADDSVHLSAWPGALHRSDPALEASMEALRGAVEIGRELRQRAQVKSRIPLPTFVLVEASPSSPLGAEGERLLAEELNVREVRRCRPEEVEAFDREAFVLREDEGHRPVALLSRHPTPALAIEGLVREALRRLQALRKELGLSYLDRIRIVLWAEGAVAEALAPARERIASELLADAVELRPGPPPVPAEATHSWELEGSILYASVVRSSGAPTRSSTTSPPGDRSQ